MQAFFRESREPETLPNFSNLTGFSIPFQTFSDTNSDKERATVKVTTARTDRRRCAVSPPFRVYATHCLETDTASRHRDARSDDLHTFLERLSEG